MHVSIIFSSLLTFACRTHGSQYVFHYAASEFSAMGRSGNFAEGMQTYYNYIRPHQGINGLTPAQMANIPINLMGNRWETMIGLAVR